MGCGYLAHVSRQQARPDPKAVGVSGLSQSEYTIRPSDRLEALINSLRTKDKRGGANILFTWGGHRKYAAACIGGSCGVLDVADSPFIGLTDGALLRPFGAWG